MKEIKILLIVTISLFYYSCDSYKEVIKGTYTINTSSVAKGEEALIFGTVISKEDNKPIPSATISVVDNYIGTITTEQGEFTIPIASGQYQLVFIAAGYDDLYIRKVILEQGKHLEIKVQLGTTKIYQKK